MEEKELNQMLHAIFKEMLLVLESIKEGTRDIQDIFLSYQSL